MSGCTLGTTALMTRVSPCWVSSTRFTSTALKTETPEVLESWRARVTPRSRAESQEIMLVTMVSETLALVS